jgi:ElaB/YqjD/DUF883 family membrane-anchored ribosome-binding protein
MNDKEKRADEIERDIEQTRADVSATIDAIQSKLTPGQMMDQAITYLRTSLPADFGRNLAETTRNNPMPVALIGVGIAWLAMSGRNGTAIGSANRRMQSDIDALGPEFDGFGSEEGPSLSERARQATHRAREAGEHARDRVGETVHGARERVGEAMHEARDTMHQVADRSRRTYAQARSSVSHVVEEQPLVIGALGLAVGAALGAALPRTEQEDELMGDARDSLMDRATDTAHEYTERATEKARRAMHDLSEKASDNQDKASSDHRSTQCRERAAATASGGTADGDRPPAGLSGEPTRNAERWADSAVGPDFR